MSTARNASTRLFHMVDGFMTRPVRSKTIVGHNTSPWVCHRCISETASNPRQNNSADFLFRRAFATCSVRRDAGSNSPTRTSAQDSSSSTSVHIPGTGSKLDHEDSASVRADQDEALPSHSQSQRSDYSKRFQAFMDDMLAKAAIAGQRLNSYTGTDYTGIETIRKQIAELEEKVKALHTSVGAAKDAYTTAHSAQVASQREVVSLLERKSSWTPHDLDRYTSLIRSEHLHDQGVTQAKQELAEAERELEEARTELEKKERRQYHEEQVWSDTIRRNSTWVTFGLMGLNILLLVSNIGIVEPWRRRRLVREVKDALDQKTFVTRADEPKAPLRLEEADCPAQAVSMVPETFVAAPETSVAAPQQMTGELVESAGEMTKVVEHPQGLGSRAPIDVAGEPETVAAVIDPDPSTTSLPAEMPTKVPGHWQEQVIITLRSAWHRTQEVYITWSTGPMSADPMTLRKIEVTSIALEGAAVGLTVAGAIVWFFRGV